MAASILHKPMDIRTQSAERCAGERVLKHRRSVLPGTHTGTAGQHQPVQYAPTFDGLRKHAITVFLLTGQFHF